MDAIRRAHRVRWSECDMHGHVNHTAYLVWFEDLRVAHWESLGQNFQPHSVGPVVGQLSVRYLAPLVFGDEVELVLAVPSLRRTSFVHQYAMWRDGLLCSARALCVVIDNATGAKSELSEPVRRLMAERDGAVAEV